MESERAAYLVCSLPIVKEGWRGGWRGLECCCLYLMTPTQPPATGPPQGECKHQCAALPGSHETRRRRRPPDHRVRPLPDFWPLRLVTVPWTGLEIAKRFVLHLIELDVEFDELSILVAMKNRDVVTRTESQRTPHERNILPSQQIA